MSELALEYLSEDDIRTLIRHPDPEKRVMAAQRICRTVRSASLSEDERNFARRLIAHMAEDAVAMVRRALAVTLQNSPHLPRDVARRLASDIDNIAVPILAHSPVLTDEDMIEVLRSRAAAKVLAVARRPIISGQLVKAIIRYGDSAAVAEVAANDGALIDVKTAETMLELYRDNDLIKDAFISRQDLPGQIIEKMITMMSEDAALIMHRRHLLPKDMAVDIANRMRERATLDVFSANISEREVRALVVHLHKETRLTRSLIIRAVGVGDMKFLKHALACRADISAEKSALMLHDGGPFGLKVLCQRAGLSETDTRLVRAGCAIYRDLEVSGLDYDRAYFQSLMMERMLTLPFDIDQIDINWFFERLDGLSEEFETITVC